MKYSKRMSWKVVQSSPLYLFAVLVIFGLLVKASLSIHKKAQLSDLRLNQAMNELSKLEQHKIELQGRVAYLSTEQGVESEFRTRYRAVKDGESVAVIIDRNEAAVTYSLATSTLVNEPGWFRRLLRKLGF